MVSGRIEITHSKGGIKRRGLLLVSGSEKIWQYSSLRFWSWSRPVVPMDNETVKYQGYNCVSKNDQKIETLGVFY